LADSNIEASSESLRASLFDIYGGSSIPLTKEAFAITTANFITVRDIFLAITGVLSTLELSADQKEQLADIYKSLHALMNGLDHSIKLLTDIDAEKRLIDSLKDYCRD
jgi:hypothetical protein